MLRACQVALGGVAVLLLMLLPAACERQSDKAQSAPPEAKVKLQGSGASFPAPLYKKWAADFSRQQPNVAIEFESKGSGAGLRDFIDGHTDFGASDAAMTDAQLIAQGNHALMLPVTAGAIVLAYNLPGVETLRLSRFVYTAIFLGRIQHWDDAAIAELNPDIKLPAIPIQVVHRSDPSGTTWVFLNHFEKANPWSERLGVYLEIDWPVGKGADGNAGVAAEVSKTSGAIGYMQSMSAQREHLAVAALENREGNYVEPTLEASRKTLLAVGLPKDMRAWMPDPVGKDSYPIVTYTWLLVDKAYEKPKADALKAFLRYALAEGQAASADLNYIPLPTPVSARVLAAVEEIGVREAE